MCQGLVLFETVRQEEDIIKGLLKWENAGCDELFSEDS